MTHTPLTQEELKQAKYVAENCDAISSEFSEIILRMIAEIESLRKVREAAERHVTIFDCDSLDELFKALAAARKESNKGPCLGCKGIDRFEVELSNGPNECQACGRNLLEDA